MAEKQKTYKCTICNGLFKLSDFEPKYQCCKEDFRFSFMDSEDDEEDGMFSTEEYLSQKE